MLAFSTVDRDSFEAIESWKRKVGQLFVLVCYNLILANYHTVCLTFSN